MVGKVIEIYKPTENGYTGRKHQKKGVMKQLKNFDDYFPDGVFAFPQEPSEPKVKVRALFNYCDERGISPEDLSVEEMEQFLDYR